MRLFLGWKLPISNLCRQSCHPVSISFHFWPYFKNDPFVSDSFEHYNLSALNQVICDSFPLQSRASECSLTCSSSIRRLTMSRSRPSMALPFWSLRNIGGDAERQLGFVSQTIFAQESVSYASWLVFYSSAMLRKTTRKDGCVWYDTFFSVPVFLKWGYSLGNGLPNQQITANSNYRRGRAISISFLYFSSMLDNILNNFIATNPFKSPKCFVNKDIIYHWLKTSHIKDRERERGVLENTESQRGSKRPCPIHSSVETAFSWRLELSARRVEWVTMLLAFFITFWFVGI